MVQSRARRTPARPIPAPELCDRYARLYVAAVTDVMDHLGRTRQTLPHDIVGLTPGARVAGLVPRPPAGH
jgi:hypothetical protein